jgi:glycerol-3-phosphate acyltransferase PlsY
VGVIWVVFGYVIGSISGARIIGRGIDLSGVRVVVSGTGETAPLEGVSPSALLAVEGTSSGLRSGAIDILKGVLVAGAALLFADPEVAAWASLAACIGHIYPMWHRFRGGFGISPLIGALLVLDPVGLIATLIIALAAGVVVGSAYVMTELWPVFLLPWGVWLDRSGPFLWFVGATTALYLWRTRREIAVAWSAWRKDTRSWSARVADVKRYPDYVPRQS